MSRSAIQVLVGFVILVGLTTGLLMRVRSNYSLGKPGVKVVAASVYDDDKNLVANESVYLPAFVEDYQSTNVPVTRAELAMLPPDTVYGRKIYSRPDGFALSTSVVLMGTDRTSIHKPQFCLVGQGETILRSDVITVPIGKPNPYELKVMKLTTTSQQRIGSGKHVTASGLYLYWFVADGQLTPYHGERMWLLGRDLLTTGVLQRWAYIAYFSRCIPGQEDVLLEKMKRFIAASVPEFQVTTGSARAANEFYQTPFDRRLTPLAAFEVP